MRVRNPRRRHRQRRRTRWLPRRSRSAVEDGRAAKYRIAVPELSRFLGIVIGIFPREHPPPHFHAAYGDYQITVEIRSGVVHGDFPKRALRLVLEWLDLHQQELLEAWDLIQAGRPANRIAPLE